MKIRFLGLLLCSLLSSATSAANLNTMTPVITGADLLRLVGGLLVVIVVIILLSWFLKRLNGAKMVGSSGLKIVSCMSLGTREKIVLLNAGDRLLLLGVTAGSINTLHDFGKELPPGFSTESKTSFSEFLKTALGKS